MKNTFTFLLFILFSVGSVSAQLTFSAKEVQIIPTKGNKTYGHIYIDNNSGHDITIEREVIYDDLNTDYFVEFCECFSCYTNEFNTIANGVAGDVCTPFGNGGAQQDWKVGVDIENEALTYGEFKVKVTNVTDGIVDTLVYKVGHPVSVIERENDFSVSYYPNPVQNELFIDAVFENNDQVNINVIDILGHSVKNEVINGTSKVFVDMSDLSKGVFFLILEKNGEIIMSERVIKN